MAKWQKQPPHLNPHIGCLTCGGGEMNKVDGEILADMDTELYMDFGGWTVTLNGKLHFQAETNEDGPPLSRFEQEAREAPDHDWRAEYYGPMREATYQRQGANRWVLISSGPGFA